MTGAAPKAPHYNLKANPSIVGEPAITVVVPCRNEVAHAETCLRSILQQETPEGDFEVIVADGMSDDGTREILRRVAQSDARLRVVDNPSRITSCGMNCAIRAARGRWVAIMGCHNQYAPDYLVRCLEAAEASGADNVGGAMFSTGEGLIQGAIAAAHHSAFSVGGARWHNPRYEGPADTVFGGFFKREVFDRLGFFDEELVRNQDNEFNFRLIRAGGRIWQCPKIKSWYHPRNSLWALFRLCTHDGYWKAAEIRKHKLAASWRHLVPGTFVLALLVLSVVSAVSLGAAALSPHEFGYRLDRVGMFNLAFGTLLLCLALYGSCALIASVVTGANSQWKFLTVLPAVFACYHFGYGYGFLRGVWDFVVCRRSPATRFVQITRRTAQSGAGRGA